VQFLGRRDEPAAIVSRLVSGGLKSGDLGFRREEAVLRGALGSE
jgi:hypothetical protein